MHELAWRNIWFADNPVDVLNEHLSLLVLRYAPTKIPRVHRKDIPWFNDQCRHAYDLKQMAYLWWACDLSRVSPSGPIVTNSLHVLTFFAGLTGKSSSAPTEGWNLLLRLNVSLVSETGTFLWTSGPRFSSGLLFQSAVSARTRRFFRLLVGVVNWYVSSLEKLICCRIIWTANGPWSLLICRLFGFPRLTFI